MAVKINCMFFAFVFCRYTVVEKRFLVDNDDVRIHVFCCEYNDFGLSNAISRKRCKIGAELLLLGNH